MALIRAHRSVQRESSAYATDATGPTHSHDFSQGCDGPEEGSETRPQGLALWVTFGCQSFQRVIEKGQISMKIKSEAMFTYKIETKLQTLECTYKGTECYVSKYTDDECCDLRKTGFSPVSLSSSFPTSLLSLSSP